MAKTRLDVLLVEKAFAPSREKAKAEILEGHVFINGERETKPGDLFDPEKSEISLRGKVLPYVSRGGYKLEKALEAFPISLSGKVCMDIGASTGGFTDCMLQNGASKVYAVDVGYGQFAWKLRNDPRVVCMEKTNIRYVTREQIGEPLQFASADVSFISLSKVLPVASSLLDGDAEMVCLIKPQFEAGREKVGKKGVVRDPKVHEDVIREVAAFSGEAGLFPWGLTYSPVKGPEGNIEYLLYLRQKEREEPLFMEELSKEVVAAAHEALS